MLVLCYVIVGPLNRVIGIDAVWIPQQSVCCFVYFQAALAGGTTMVIGHVLPEKNESLLDAYEKCRSHADAKACCDYALHVGVTWWGPKVQSVFAEYANFVSIVEFP